MSAGTLFAMLQTSCMMFKSTHEVDYGALMPEAFSDSRQAEDRSAPAPTGWWQDFADETLNTLVGSALTQNLTLAQADARLRQAGAQAAKAGAALIPELTLSAGAGQTRTRVAEAPPEGNALTTDTEKYSLGGAFAGYEADLWGRVRSTRNAARNQFKASYFDLCTAMMTLSADLTTSWFSLRALQSQRALLGSQYETGVTLVDLLKVRQRRSQSSALEVYQQEQNTAAIAALLPQVDAQLAVLTNQLNILLGRSIGAPLPESDATLPALPPIPETGLPADLLTNRPDIQAARQRLESAGWNLAAAKADRLPALRLNGSATYQSEQFSELFDNWILNIAAGLTAPLIDGGRRRAEVARQEAVLDEYLAAYKAVLIQAVADVENALHRERAQRRHLEALEREVSFARLALTEAQTRYRKGSIDYLNVLAALTSTQRLERELITAKNTLLSYRISLYRALGGSWMEPFTTKSH